MSATREREIFMELVAHVPPEHWQGRLAELAGEDAELHGKVRRLLAAHRQADSFLEKPVSPLGGTVDGAPAPAASARAPAEPGVTEGAGTVVGSYKLLEQIGEGGFGVVFMAEQQHPVRRKVALKVIKPGMDTRQVVARFEAERQALALMDHPNIAQVFDGGETVSGRPYFVMELVRGIPITEFCDQSQRSIRERLALFVTVSQAVQHAHQKGIIHRDLKPSNVLVTLYDDKPVVKVIDFGIAKATGQQLTEKTLFTNFAQLIGTPLYMSPEQAQLSGLDIDTRSDIYSLGVLLYELLTGITPFDKERLRTAAYDEIMRIIREEEPAKPSTRISRLGQTATAVSANRKSDPKRLVQLCRGELDWIVMKALEKDRNRRYESASAFAADVQRYLHDEPVQACSPSAWYRFRKFAQRKKGVLATATALAVAVLLALAGLAVTVKVLAESNQRIVKEQQQTKDALAREKQAGEALVQALEQEHRTLYLHRIALAHRELLADNLGRAQELLEDCPPEFRQWEWKYLKRLCRVDPTTLRVSEKGLYSAAFSPDGLRLATANGDGTIDLFDVQTGERLDTLRGHKDYVFSVAFHPKGKYLASASADRTVQVWDLTAHQVSKVYSGQEGVFVGGAYGVAFSPDGRLLAAGRDENLMVWDAVGGQEILALSGHEKLVTSVAFSPDGLLLASGSFGGVLRIWDCRTGELLWKVQAQNLPIAAVAFRPDGRWVATASYDRTVKVWDVGTRQPAGILRGHTGLVLGLTFSPDGKRLATSGEDKTVKIWDVDTGQEQLNLRGHTSICSCVTFSPDGGRLASSSLDGTVRLWDASPLTGSEGARTLTLQHEDEVWSVAFHPDGQSIASGSWDGTVRIWDATSGASLRTLTGAGRVFRVAFSSDGKYLASCGGVGFQTAVRIKVWEAATGHQLHSIPDEFPPFCVTFSPDSHYLVRGGGNHAITTWDVQTGKKVGTVGRHAQDIWCLACSPDGRLLASASNDGSVKLWDATRLGQQQTALNTIPLRVTRGSSHRVAFSSDSRHLVTAGEESTVNVWDARTRQEIMILRGHTGDVACVAVSPDGNWIASAGEDTTVRLWDARTGQPLHKLRGHTSLVSSLAFSRDSRRLVSGSRDHTVRVWDLTRWHPNFK